MSILYIKVSNTMPYGVVLSQVAESIMPFQHQVSS